MSADSGMALGILIAMILIVSVPGVIFGAIGLVIGNKRTEGESKKGLAYGCGGFVLGVVVGIIGLFVTFYESAFEATLKLETPPGFTHDAVLILGDPTASTRLDWNTMRTEATLVVPPSGVVRVPTLEDFETMAFFAELPSGEASTSFSSRPAPGSLAPVTVVRCVGFGTSTDCENEDVEALIRSREAAP